MVGTSGMGPQYIDLSGAKFDDETEEQTRARLMKRFEKIGLTLMKACNQPGIDDTGTNVLLPNDSGKMSRNMIPCTDPDVRAIIPTKTEIQQKHSANAIETPIAAIAASGFVVIRNPIT